MVDTLDKTYHVNADTWIDQGHVGDQNGRAGQLVLKNNVGAKKYALVHISVPGLPGATVHNATLTVFLKGTGWGDTDNIYLDLLDVRFTEKETWHSYHLDLPTVVPGADSGDVGSPSEEGQRVDIDVTTLLQDAADADAFRGFLVSVNVNGDHAIYSSETSRKNKRPFLTIKYSLPPDPPTGLRPANYASAQKPLLAWDCVPQSEFEVQISTAGTVPSIVADSGWIVTDVQQTDSSDDAAWDTPWSTDLPANADTTYWRVRIKDEVGTPSDWSPWVSWERRVLSSLTIDSPTEAEVVDNTRPDFQWTFGGTQTMWQLDIEDLDYDTGRTPDDDDSHRVPIGTLRERNVSMRAVLRVWDPYLRDAPGDSSFVEVVRTFSYDGTAGPTGTTGLQVTADGPAQILDWFTAAAPESFVIFADDEIIVDQIAEDDVHVSGNHYRYRLLRIGTSPVSSVTFQVESHFDVTGDSIDSDEDEGLSGPQGVWLVYEEEDIEVEFLGQPEIELKVSEDGATYFPLGSKSPIRIVDQIRGYEGSVTGLVSGNADLALFEQIKAVPPGSVGDDGLGVLRLIFGRYNFPVDIGEVTISQWPHAEGDNQYNVSFEFWQVSRPWPV